MTIKDKLYNYEVTPPVGVWDDIVLDLDKTSAEIIQLNKKKNTVFYYSLAAASVAIILFALIFFSSSETDKKEIVTSPVEKLNNDKIVITVPVEENKTVKDKSPQVLVKTRPDKKAVKEKVHTPQIAKNEEEEQKDYITMAGPEGQSIKVSTKAASLMDSADEKPVWNKKVKQWKEMMKANTLAPTPGNFLDIIELTKSLRDK